MKVVILHDWLTGFRGGERVLEAICEIYPDAPIYTLLHNKNTCGEVIESRKIHCSFLDKIPGIYKHYRKFLPLMPLAAGLIKIPKDVDLVISSSHCVIKGVKKPKAAKHISYIHSPMRYIYDQFDNYFSNSSLLIRTAAHIFRPYLIWWDKKSNKNIDVMIANSNFVKERIKKYYERDAIVINPFVDLNDFKDVQQNPPQKEEFYLMVSAFAPNKRVDLAIEAFNELGENYKLKIIGSGSAKDEKSLRAIAKPNIEFLGNLSRTEVIDHYARTKAFIFPGLEDFGITPLEANAAGTSLIAYGYAGVLETQTKKTSQFYYKNTSSELVNSIVNFDKKNIFDLISNAEKFSKEKFLKEITEIISLS